MLTPTRDHARSYDLPRESFVEILHRAAREHGDAAAVLEGDVRLSYDGLLSAAERVAGGLCARGVRPGDRVVTQLPNWWESVVVSWGVFLAGAVLVPVVPIYRAQELRFIIDQVRPAAVFAPAEFRSYRHAEELREVLAELDSPALLISVRGGVSGAEHLESFGPPADFVPDPDSPEPGDIAVVLYTSGTTSQPKGALHSHQTLLAEVRQVASWCRLDSGDRVFMASPLSHITGLSYGILLPVELGCTVVLQERWDPARAVDLIESTGCTFTVSATPFLRGLADGYAQRGRSSLRIFICGGADIPADLVRHARRVMGTAVLRTYGSTELPTSSMADPSSDLDAAATSDGTPMGDNEMRRVVYEGSSELHVRGPELFLGYLDPALNDAAFTADGWFRTGDDATIDPDGTVRITGRIKDIINRGGEKFSVAEVESVLLTHPSVADVAVVSYPDPLLVERACAVVVPRTGHTPTVRELRDHVVAAGLAVQKAPELVLLVDDLPRTASGKVQRYRLRAQVRDDLSIRTAPAGAPNTDR